MISSAEYVPFLPSVLARIGWFKIMYYVIFGTIRNVPELSWMEGYMNYGPYKLMTAMATTATLALLPTAGYGETMITPMLKTTLEDLNGAEANILIFDVDPGFVTDRHTHPGHVFIYVLEGALQLDIEGQESSIVSAGEAMYELANVPMTGRNLSATERAKFVVFQVGPAGEPIMVPAPE